MKGLTTEYYLPCRYFQTRCIHGPFREPLAQIIAARVGELLKTENYTFRFNGQNIDIRFCTGHYSVNKCHGGDSSEYVSFMPFWKSDFLQYEIYSKGYMTWVVGPEGWVSNPALEVEDWITLIKIT